MRRATGIATLCVLILSLGMPSSQGTGPRCTGTPIVYQAPPPTILKPNPPITYGGNVSCPEVKQYVHIVMFLGDQTNCCATVDMVEQTRYNSAGFTLTDTYKPNVCSALSLNRTYTWRLDVLWDWKNPDGSTNADYRITNFTTHCPL